jgi:hypothetical protein
MKKILKSMRKIYGILLLTFVILIQSCSQKNVNVTSINIAPYIQNEGGKFMTICLSEPLENRETIYVKFVFLSKENETSEYESTFYGEDKKCIKFNIFVYLLYRNSNKKEKDFLRNHLNYGNIKTLNIEIFDDYEGRSLFKGTFNNL